MISFTRVIRSHVQSTLLSVLRTTEKGSILVDDRTVQGIILPIATPCHHPPVLIQHDCPRPRPHRVQREGRQEPRVRRGVELVAPHVEEAAAGDELAVDDGADAEGDSVVGREGRDERAFGFRAQGCRFYGPGVGMLAADAVDDEALCKRMTINDELEDHDVSWCNDLMTSDDVFSLMWSKGRELQRDGTISSTIKFDINLLMV